MSSVNINQENKYEDFFLNDSSYTQFKFLGDCDDNSRDFKCSDVSLRILLIQQFEQSSEQQEKCFWKPANDEIPYEVWPVVKAIRAHQSQNRDLMVKRTYWNDQVVLFCLNKSLKIPDLNAKQEHQIEDELLVDLEGDDKGKVQIVAVGELESAEVLMSFCKFDVILLNDTGLFNFFLGNGSNPTNQEFINTVKLNRGPLDKYWVLSMKDEFLADLHKNDIRMTDHRWNIFIGCNPQTNEFEFLYRLNEIIDLQLRLSVFRIDTLLTFLLYTCEDVKDHIANRTLVFEDGKAKKRTINEYELFFESFQDYMGAEYANLMKRYGARKLIERDASKRDDQYNKSLFSTYVYQNFYLNRPVEMELVRLMQSFYHQAAVMFNDRNGRQRLRESFEALRNFISYNGLELEECKNKRLLEGMSFLRAVIDSDFYLEKMKKWLKKR